MAGLVVTTLRPMEEADLPAVLELEESVYADPWPRTMFLGELRGEHRLYLVAESQERIIGYGGWALVEEDRAHLTSLTVAADARRRGLGTRLLLALVEAALSSGARRLSLELRFSNLAARRLYRRFGFAPVGVRPGYYPDEDALVMWAERVDQPAYRKRLAEIRRALS